ncbi:hypothetical protein [Mesorhizobium sp. Root552]|uniref:hypothetical protein n=1 Tax=Mesorhizobium sp. Root552 TaxID=1736555 RepID=UPI000B314D84|nr:hypothetical protein [Mesorhizobium sp. Root552]
MASGDRPDTGRKPSGKKAKKLSQKEQSERFKETARKLEIDESGNEFEAVVRRILPKKT